MLNSKQMHLQNRLKRTYQNTLQKKCFLQVLIKNFIQSVRLFKFILVLTK
jgi:hypothetical protein